MNDVARKDASLACALVIFCATGDLTRRLLIPALRNLRRDGLLPEHFGLIGLATREISDEGFRAHLRQGMEQFEASNGASDIDWFVERTHYLSGKLDDPITYQALAAKLKEVETVQHTAGNVLFYLATPSGEFVVIVDGLGKAGLTLQTEKKWRRVTMNCNHSRIAHPVRQEIIGWRTQVRRIGHRLFAMAAALLVASAAGARTADISLTVIGDERMAEELKDLSKDLDKAQPLSGDSLSLLQAVQARRARIVQALRSRGFYDSRVTATISNQPIEDVAALDAIEAQPEAETANFAFNVATGPVYRVTDLEIQGPANLINYPPLDRGKLSLIPGQPADAAKILETEEEILNIVRGKGYPLASIAKREVLIDHATREARVTFVVQAGPVATMGPVHFSGTNKVDTTYLQRRVPFKEGEPYEPAKVNALRDRLTSLGTFSAVRVKPAPALDSKGQLPIDVDLQDRAPRTIGFGLSYETVLGFAINGYWQHRNLFGEAESLRLSAEVNNIGYGTLGTDTGYGFKADFRKPDWWVSQQDATASLVASRDVFPAYTRKGVIMVLGLDRIIDPHWRVKVGLSGEVSEIERYGITNDYKLIGIPMQAILNQSDSDLEPTKGYRFTFNVTPYADLYSNNDLFAITRLTGAGYVNVSGDGRSVVAGRASFGTIPGGTNAHIPFDKLFYAGGGGSVRGFSYQSAGPRDAFNNPLGGASVMEGSIEFRQRIGRQFGAVAFFDAGAAYLDNWPDFSQFAPRMGTGVGVRYYTDFGPARLDFGLPLNPRQGDAPFGIYVSIGQAF